MNYYEIILIVNPKKIKKNLNIIKKYKNIIINSKGKIYRFENLGLLKMSYKIKNFKEANYLLINIKVTKKVIKYLEKLIRFNENIIRKIIIKKKYKKLDKFSIIEKK